MEDYSDLVAKIIGNVADLAESNREKKTGDYVGEDGLLRCGVCGEKKEKLIELDVGSQRVRRKVGCICRCVIESKRRQAEEDAKREAIARAERMRDASLMDAKFFKARFGSHKETEKNAKNFRLCMKYAESFEKMVEHNQGLLFWGDIGTGKSYAAACIANSLMDRGIPVIMTSFVKLLEASKDKGRENQDMARIMTAKLVIFDDLGAERNTEYASEKIYNFLDSRYRSNLPMIVTTNIPFKDMLSETDTRYKRIYDRIFEVCYPVHWEGDSWRKAMAGERFAEMEDFLRRT